MATLDRYREIQREFAENGCVLQTSFEEFGELVKGKIVQHVRISFTGKCGHPSSAVYTNFHLRKTGIFCKTCVQSKNKQAAKEKDKDIFVKQESVSMNYLTNLLSSKYSISRTDEGCSADMLVRKIESTDDAWLRIQVKTTKEKIHNMHVFQGFGDKYKDMVIICHSLSDNKLWIFPYNDVKVPRKLNISSISKYNVYLCEESELLTKLSEYYDRVRLISEAEGKYQHNKYQRREAVYAKKRIEILSFLEFKKHEVQYTSTDFTVNGKKVQEKVVGAKHGESYVFQLSRNNGRENRNRNYRLGENDVYWFHSSFNELFWIVPEIVMFNEGLLSKSDETKPPKHFMVNPNTYKSHPWLKQYEFDYTKITPDIIGCIKGMFSIL